MIQISNRLSINENKLQKITEIDNVVFNYLQFVLQKYNLDQDRISFKELRNLLNNGKVFTPEEFAYEVFYVICVAGFKQDYAKSIHEKIIKFIEKENGKISFEGLSTIYGNKNKVKSILNVWENREIYQNKFYSMKDINKKVDFLATLPHIGNITKFHLARNLGLNFVKYDIWIQRLGVALYGDENLINLVNNAKLLPVIKAACDVMFDKIHKLTLEKKGFIDVVLWRSCQKGLLIIDKNDVYINSKIYKNNQN